ncbi:hypothetical protein CEXT_399601 [Caerostris extrusa]|uniref:Uncharacterized protein n=1 Tax=Caerostris extrusa TaxID=172846 RepID=A0AAV4QGC6_CAEEX|nr:hypothetical protein CEXT_399601 [Caerostris extrusa]
MQLLNKEKSDWQIKSFTQLAGRIQRFLGGTSQTSLKRDHLNRITDCISQLASAGLLTPASSSKTGAQREPLPTYSPNQTRQRIIPNDWRNILKFLFCSEKMVKQKKIWVNGMLQRSSHTSEDLRCVYRQGKSENLVCIHLLC